MTARECRILLDQHLSSFFDRIGYSYLPELSQYRRYTPYGFSCLIVSVSPYDKDCLVEMFVGLRRDDVEGMIYSSTNGLKDFAENSMTLVGSLGKLVGKPHLRYVVEKEADISELLRRC